MKEKDKIITARSMIKGILSWSDRIGSDEIGELQQILKVLR